MTTITRQAIADYISTTSQVADDFCIDALAEQVSNLHDFTSKFTIEQLEYFLSMIKNFNFAKGGYERALNFFRNHTSSQTLNELEKFREEFEIYFIDYSITGSRWTGKSMTQENWGYFLPKILVWFGESYYQIRALPEPSMGLEICNRCHYCIIKDFRKCLRYKSKTKLLYLRENLRFQKEKKELLSEIPAPLEDEVKVSEHSASDLKKKEKRAEKRRRQKERRRLEKEEVIVFNPSVRQLEQS